MGPANKLRAVARAPTQRLRKGLIQLDSAPPRGLARLGLAARGALNRLADRIVPAEVLAYETAISFFRTRVAGALLELGVIDAIGEGGGTTGELAARLDLDADYLGRTLRLAATYGLLRIDASGRCSLTPVGDALRSDASPSLGPWTRYINLDSTQRAWAGLPEAIRTGRPAFPAVHGASVWEHFANHPEEERAFAAAMREVSLMTLPFIVSGYPWPERGVVADIAGGSGPVLAAILGERPELRGVLVEARGVLADADAHLARVGVRDRVELSEGDMFTRVEAKADLYLLKDILHDWDDERSLQILRTVAAAMPPGSRLILIETLLEPGEPDPIAEGLDLHMLTQCDGGRQRSAEELRALIREAGLRPGEVHRTAAPALVEALA